MQFSRQFGKKAWPFLAFLFSRFVEDRCVLAAAALSYTSLLAFVPVMAIVFSAFAIFPGLDATREAAMGAVFDNFAPHMEGTIKDAVSGFAENARRVTAFGFLVLFATGVMLLSMIEKTFNQIWRVTTARKLVPRLLAYWAVMTLGPVLVGTGLSVSGYLYTATEWLGSTRAEELRPFLRFLPFLFETLALGLLYIAIPNRDVSLRHALAGGIVAAVLFETAKKGFGIYLSSFANYEAIYGALAAIPVFLVWMYISWLAVLAGGLFAAALGAWREAPAAS